ncbi:ribonuclease H-like domain-containing protein [Tanacetum coccineum]
MAESAKRHEENLNIIKEIRASTNAAIRNQGASIKTLEIQIRQMSKVLQERGFRSLPSSTETNPRDQVKSISTAKADFSKIRRIGYGPYAVSDMVYTPYRAHSTGAYFLKQSLFQDDCKTLAVMIGERHKMLELAMKMWNGCLEATANHKGQGGDKGFLVAKGYDRGPGFYQQNNGNSSYPDRRLRLEESLTKFMAESAKRHEENSNIIKEIRASTDAAIRNRGASMKTLEIQIGQMSKVLQERGFGSRPNYTEINPRDQVKSIPTAKANFSGIRQAQDEKILDAYDHTLPQKEKDPGSFPLPCFIHNICFDKALVDLGASMSIIPFSTYTNLGLGILSHTRLTIELADRTIKQPRGIIENVLVRIGKFIFPIDFIILDIPEDDDVPLILGRPFLSTAHFKIDVFKKKITLRAGEEKLVFKSFKPATSIIKKVFAIKSLDSKTEFIGEGDEPFDPTYGSYIELNDLDTPLQPKTNRDVDFEPTFVKIDFYNMKFSCVIGYKYVTADLLPSLPINLMSKSFYYSIIEDKDEGMSHAETLIDIPVFFRSFSIILGFTIIDDDDMTKDVVLDMKFYKKYASCQMIMRKFAHEDEHEQYGDLPETMIWYMLKKTCVELIRAC